MMVDGRKNIPVEEHQRRLDQVAEYTEFFAKFYIVGAFSIGVAAGYMFCWMT